MRTPPNECVSPDIVEHGKARSDSGPERRCILSGETASRDALVRLAISPDGDVLPDPLAKAPGRGAWIGVSRGQLEEALAKGRLKAALARAFKGAPLSIPDDLPQRIEDSLRKLLLDRLGIAMRGGAIVLGSDRLAEQARMGRVAWLAHAADASDDGARKLDQAFRVGRDAEGSGLGGIRLPLDRAALSVALGRENVVHLALADRKSAERVTGPLDRLLHFRGSQSRLAGEQVGESSADQGAIVARDSAATN